MPWLMPFGRQPVEGEVLGSRLARRARTSANGRDGLALLTRTEKIVAGWVARGPNNSEIAEQLVLAEGTIKNHISALLRKLDAPDRTALALRLAKTLGL